MSVKTSNDYFRMAMRDLRGSDSLIRLATGTARPDDLQQLTQWADDINSRLGRTKVTETVSKTKESIEVEVTSAPAKSRAKRGKKAKPLEGDIAFARAVSEELADDKVKAWAEDFASGNISEAQWINRLTTHAAATRETLDDIYERAHKRLETVLK